MGKHSKKVLEEPTPTFPYRIARRLNFMAYPRREVFLGYMPATTQYGVRVSALQARTNERIVEIAYPSLRQFRETKRMYKSKFSEERLERFNQMMAAANSTFYAKLANTAIETRKVRDLTGKKKRGWTATDWKKHMEYINRIAEPKRVFEPDPIDRGEPMTPVQLVPSVQRLVRLPNHRVFRTLSQDLNYRDPTKVSPAAKKYVLTEHTKKLAQPRVYSPD